MTKGGRIAAGIFGIIGSAIYLLIAWIFYIVMMTSPVPNMISYFLISLAIGALGLVGGILLITDKTAGGVLAVIAGTVSLIMQIYWILPMATGPIVFFIWLFFVPPALLLVAGIVGLSVGSEF